MQEAVSFLIGVRELRVAEAGQHLQSGNDPQELGITLRELFRGVGYGIAPRILFEYGDSATALDADTR